VNMGSGPNPHRPSLCWCNLDEPPMIVTGSRFSAERRKREKQYEQAIRFVMAVWLGLNGFAANAITVNVEIGDRPYCLAAVWRR
jgi:hypothetical protein